MDPLTSLLASLDQAASTRSPSAQDVLAHANAPAEQAASQRTTAPSEQAAPQRTTAPSEQVAPQRTTTAPSELVVPRRSTSSPGGNDATDDVAEDADGDESSLSPASPEFTQRPRWDDLGKSYDLSCNLMHKSIPSFSFKATVTKPRSSSSSRVVIPSLSSAALQDGSYQPGRAYHSTHDDRRNFRAARALWGIEGRWGLQQLIAREEILQELFPDLGESSYENWDYQQQDALQAFMDQRQLAAPTEPRHIWKLDGPLEDAPVDEIPTSTLLHMAHAGPLPPIWDLLDCAQPQLETLHLLNLEEFTDLVNGCAPDDLLRNAFVILRMVATARYLHLKAQELHDALINAHITIGDNLEEKIRLREKGPDIEASAQSAALLTDQLVAMSTKHQQSQRGAR